jgi:pyruvate,orthophosphate dikinase
MVRRLVLRGWLGDSAINEGMPMAPHVSIFGTTGSTGAAGLSTSTPLGPTFSPGFAVTTRLPTPLAQVRGRIHPSTLQASVGIALRKVEKATGRALGHSRNPLFLEIAPEGGRAASIQYLGVNDESVDALAQKLGDIRDAWDCYRRFMQSYGSEVLGVDQSLFAERVSLLKAQRGVEDIDDLSAVDLQILVGQFRDLIEGKLYRPLLQDPYAQLWCIIGTAFRAGLPAWGNGIVIRAMAIGDDALGEQAALASEAIVRSPSRQEDLPRH